MEGTCLNPAILDVVGKSVSGTMEELSMSPPGAEAHSLQCHYGCLLRYNAVLYHKESKYSSKGQAEPCDLNGW